MKILITGGGGLIGQAIAKQHLLIGDEVYIYDDKSNKFNDYTNMIGVDCFERNLEELITTEKFDVISHQASSVGVGESQYNVLKYTDNNLLFTAKLLQAILNSKQFPKKLILASSMGPYGEGTYWCNNKNCLRHGKFYFKTQRTENECKCPHCKDLAYSQPISEADERNPQSIYAITKQTQEEMFRIFADTYGIKTVALRYFSIYGSECNPNNPFTGVLSIIANKIINSNQVSLFEDGEQTRDLTHADDCASIHVKASQILLLNMFEAINVGTGKSVSMKYIAHRMIDILAPDTLLVFNRQIRKGDIKHSNANVAKAKALLDWESKVDIDKSIEEYCAFIYRNWNSFKTTDTCAIEQQKLTNLNLIR